MTEHNHAGRYVWASVKVSSRAPSAASLRALGFDEVFTHPWYGSRLMFKPEHEQKEEMRDMEGTVYAVVGGQFGSEGKGAIVNYLTNKLAETRRVLVVRTGGPNAGHTAYDQDGKPWRLRQVPVGAVARDPMRVEMAIAAHSEVDHDVLIAEANSLEAAGFSVRRRLLIDNAATMLTHEHHEAETNIGLQKRIGSTQKGIGACRAARIMRTAYTVRDDPSVKEEFRTGSARKAAYDTLEAGGAVVIETSQGFGLSLFGPYYPFATSQDCNAATALSDVGLLECDKRIARVVPVVVLRTFPIRVAGNSGPLPNERTWEELSEMSNGHIQPERTTVTNKVRRVGSWDEHLAREAVEANGGSACEVALTFFDYLYPGCAGQNEPQKMPGAAYSTLSVLEAQMGAPIRYVGTGPDSVIELPPAKRPIDFVPPGPGLLETEAKR